MITPIKIVVKKSGDVTIHTFISSFEEGNIANATHIIESKNVLVIIDGQFYRSYAKQFRAYADSLQKPIERLYISHRHPDHWFGAGDAFSDIPMYSLPETLSFIKAHGAASKEDHQDKMGKEAPTAVVVPEHSVFPGVEKIDGVTYVFERVVDTEIDFLLTIKLPELGVHIVQDLVYSGTHLYLTKDLDRWIEILEGMLVSDYELFLAGHGYPADKKEVFDNMKYLVAAQNAMQKGLQGDDFKKFMINRFPTRECAGIFDIYIPRLFDGAISF